MRIFSVRWRITFGLICLLTSLLVIAELIGVVPNEDRATVRGRAQLCESIAISSSVFVSSNDIAKLEAVLDAVVQRNRSLLSAAIRRNNRLIVEVGDHSANWKGVDATHSTETHVHVPIITANKKWGTVQLRFEPLAGNSLRARMASGDLRFLGFVGAGSFVCFWFYLGRTLQQIDPSQAVPNRVRSALDTLTEGLLVIDRQNRIVLANEAFAEWVGKKPDALMGTRATKLPWQLGPDEEVESYPFPWLQALANEEPLTNAVIQLRDTTGTERTLLVNSSPVMGQNGRYGGVLTSFEDVTELEESRAQLSKAKDAADMANRAKSDFLARMSHEIRTPMNAILGFTDVLRRGIDKTQEDRQRFLDTIHASGEHLLALINDILDLSKIESGRMDLELKRHSPHDMIAHVVSVFRMKAEEKNVRLEFTCDGKIPETILTDKVRFRQTIMNLVSNSIKFTNSGSVRVVAQLTKAKTSSPQLVVRVVDTGVGISNSSIDKIFQPFAQADSSITRRFGGTGLGLAIVQQLSEALGGGVSVASKPGTGSTFTVTFGTGDLQGVPLLDAAEVNARISSPGGHIDDQRRLPPARMLVVDDGEANRELITLFLNEFGVDVDAATNGAEAIELISKHRYDAVLMDMQMPVMDGYTATRQLRSMGCSLPIVALTAHAMASDEAKCLEAGCSSFMTKPVDIDRLYQSLAEILATTQLPRPANSATDAQWPADRSRIQANAAEPAFAPDPCDAELAAIVHETQMLQDEMEGALDAAGSNEPLRCRLPLNDERFQAIVQRFAVKLDEQLNAMRTAAKADDFEELKSLAHWLKGTGGTAGFQEFTAPAARLEQLASEQRSSEIDGAIQRIQDLANRMPADEPAARLASD